MAIMTKRFTNAVDYARVAHAAQTRKGTDIPYLYHLLGVASLVIEHGPNVAKGEAALRERYRVALQPVAASWRKFIRGLFRHMRQAQRQARHTAASAPRAEALRLRTTTIASLDAVLGSLERVAP